MAQSRGILNADQMRELYGNFYDNNPKLNLDRRNVPESVWILLPYAEFWGVSDDLLMEQLINGAPQVAKKDLRDTMAAYNEELTEWLAGPEAYLQDPSDEYIAFSAMRMAADCM